ncbi:BTAD domain-containing putative transcriptional regulator [Streptomyces sp. DSM 44915]|uniref:BTAD domain-containing putative transcriptional regulator n=1 Tax=Streptomyces chisholmiae TaxID=3075540 RepID=A0ABU2JNW6_9ACTN|nr:BTAD domain-containing putative transcriptional regulator [Streptomyces sp. DSM 44915]MDT0266688.1 BTAD domain-containing putative transcriptional regulator [Streptomyces sp. DSM 44915]
MEFQVLGQVAIRREAAAEPVPGRLRRVLLGMLLAAANRPVSVGELTEALWGERADDRAGQRLHLHVHRLRAALDDPERLSLGPDGYRLRVAPGELDAERFEELVGLGTSRLRDAPAEAVTTLRAALDRWHGTPLAGLDHVPALRDWGRRLAERRLAGREALYQAELARGNHAAVVGELTGLVAEHPLRERFHGLLMTALHRSGRQREALAAYRRARQLMVDELGLEPGSELRELERRIRAGESLDEPRADADQVPPAQLPADIAGFVGRQAELAELDGLVAGHQPVVVSAVAGTAGVGKTALAVRWAHRVRDRFPDGQLYVDLRGYGPEQPVTAQDALGGFLRALGLTGGALPRGQDERAARFRSLVAGRRLLVVLDNARSADQVRPLLPGGTAGFALVTSRDALAGLVSGEGARRLRLDRLSRADARALLHEVLGARATAEPDATDALIERCARLPLALRITAELADVRPGARLADLAAELADQQGALDLLDLDNDPYTAVRAVFSWSYRQLDPTAARVFRLLGTHPGQEVEAHAVAALVGEELAVTRRALTTLTRAHLLDEPTAGHYQPHDLLRAYAAELAATTDPAADRAAALARLRAFYLATASAAMGVLVPYDQDRRPRVPAWPGEAPGLASEEHAARWLIAELDNLLAVTRDSDAAFTITLSDTVERQLDRIGRCDALLTLSEWKLRAARAVGDLFAEARAESSIGQAVTLLGGDFQESIGHLERARDGYLRAGQLDYHASALNNLGIAYGRAGQLAQALPQFEAVLALDETVVPRSVRRSTLVNACNCLTGLGRYREALGHAEQALALARALGDITNESNSLSAIAELHLRTGDPEQARVHAEQGLELARRTGYRAVACDCLRLLGRLRRLAGDHAAALELHEEALAVSQRAGAVHVVAEARNELAASLAAAGQHEAALRHYRESLELATRTARLRAHVAESQAGAAAVHLALGDRAAARDHLRQALAHYTALDLPQADEVRARLAELDDDEG